MGFSIFDVLITVLAGWRITSVLNREKIGTWFRAKFAGERKDVMGLETYPDTFRAALVTCFWCLSFWVSLFCFACLLLYPLFLYPFAISAAIILIDERALHG